MGERLTSAVTGGDGPGSRPLPSTFYDRPSLEVARDLLGAVLVHDGVAVRLSEVEAYAGEADPASHAYRGLRRRNAPLFGPPGRSYVYFVYGMHWCVNVVCLPEGQPSAVLLRAGEVVAGLDIARTRRRTAPTAAAPADRELARGPARLARTVGMNGRHDGHDMTRWPSPVVLPPTQPVPDTDVMRGPRVGVRHGAVAPWRLWVRGDPTVSAFRAGRA